MKSEVLLLLCIFVMIKMNTKTYFVEEFQEETFKRWVKSNYMTEEQGTFELNAGKWYGDKEISIGLKTGEEQVKKYFLSSKIPDFSNLGEELVIQYNFKMESLINCGGGYIKLHPPGFDQDMYGNRTHLVVMFGPDICGGISKVIIVLDYKGKGYLWKKAPEAPTDKLSHLYTLVIFPNNSYKVDIDMVTIANGSIVDDFGMLPPKEIEDPQVKKPSDWVDNENMDDPESVKPADWVEVREIPDPKSEKPDDWDDDNDGKYVPPMIPNPNYKGPWSPKQIKNPNYKGLWIAPKIPNPDFKDDPEAYVQKIGGVGIEVMQMVGGHIWDNILLTNSVDYAKSFAEKTWKNYLENEKSMWEEQKPPKPKLSEEELNELKAKSKHKLQKEDEQNSEL